MLGWMAYATLLAGLFGVAGLLVERVLRGYGRPTRWVWGLGLGASIAAPLVVGFLPRRAATAANPMGGVVVLDPLVAVAERASTALPSAAAPLLALWLLASASVLSYLAVSYRSLRRRHGGWRPAEVEGMPVMVSRSTGPAAVGLLRSVVVLPEWALRLDRSARQMLVAHEGEHARSGDPRLLLYGLVAAALMPWNPVVWWQLRRLRLAVEVDCDARVLRRGVDPERYGAVLLDVGRRRMRPLPAGVGFSVRRSQLERRIRVMTTRAPRHRLARAVLAVAVVAIVLAAACEVPVPGGPGGEGGSAGLSEVPTAVDGGSGAASEPTFTPFTVAPDLENPREVQRALEREYPPLLRDAGIGGRVVVWFFIDESGRVLATQVKESSGHTTLDEAALRVAREMRFSPARNGDELVPVWVSIPITFSTGTPVSNRADRRPADVKDEVAR